MMKFRWLLIFILLSSTAFSQTESQQTYPSSFYIKESQPVTTQFQDLLQLLEHYFIQGSSVIDMLKFSEVLAPWGPTREKYQRSKHFGGWIKGQGQEPCQNTRAVVLIRHSQPNQIRLSNDGCRVEKGSWLDPLTGQRLTYATDVQIDHFVPLKNAFVSNAALWNFEKRCLYANFIKSEFHLLPVFGRENSIKGDRGPEAYMPSNQAYSCQYLKQWLQIKLVWGLRMNPDEALAIQELAETHQCSRKDFQIPQSTIQKIRKDIAGMQNLCRNAILN